MALFKRKLTKKDELNRTERKGYSFGFLDSLNLYTRIIADRWTKGRADNPTDKMKEGKPLGDTQFFYSVNRIFTNQGIKKPYFLSLPEYIDRGFISDIRDDIDRAVQAYNLANQTNENVSVTVIADGKNFPVDLSQGSMQGRFKVWARDYENIRKKAQNKRLEDELKSDKHTQQTRHKVGSYLYIKEAVEKEKASFYKTNIIIELVATSDDVLDKADKELRSTLFQLDAKSKEVFIQTNEYMRSYSPMANSHNSLIQQMNPRKVFADETLSSLTVPTHGVIGDERGTYHGVDVLSRRVVTFDMADGPDANTILLTAMSGEGKSNFAKMLYTFYPMDDNFGTVVFDYEGTEYTPLAKVIKSEIISMTASSGRYVNTIVIGRPVGVPEIDKELKTMAQTTTVSVFDLLVDEDDGMTGEQEAILSRAIKEVFVDFGVTEEKETWKNSEGITFFHLYQKVKDFLNKREYSQVREDYEEENIKNFVLILRPYFEEGEIYKHWFKEAISVQEIIDNKHVVFSFGMGKSTETMENKKSLALRQLFAVHITTLLANNNKMNGRKTVVFIEELQRYLKQKYSGEIVSKLVTGGRKQGIITYLITNSPSELLGLTENDSDAIRDNATAIMSNITMYLIGALLREDMDNLIDAYGLENSRGVLNQLSTIAERDEVNIGLKYCFYVRYKGQSALLRMLSHPSLEELPLYKTEVEKDAEGNEKEFRTVEKMSNEEMEEGLDHAEKEDRELEKSGASFDDYRNQSKKSKSIWKDKVDVNI